MSHTHKREEPYLTYLEALDEEHWHLKREVPHDPIRDEYRYALQAYEEAAQRTTDPSDPELRSARDTLDQKELVYRSGVRERLHAAARSALCFSGGGMRSATFGLGVLQGLASKGLLRQFDFLSTVSGGAHLGGWLSAWIHRAGVDDVEERLGSIQEASFDAEPGPISHLRVFSRYLSPELGLTSPETWTRAFTYLCNMALNWVVLLPAFAALLLLPLLAWSAIGAGAISKAPIYSMLAAGLLSATIAAVYVALDLPSGGDLRKPYSQYLVFYLGMLTLAAVCLTAAWAWLPASGSAGPWWDVVRLGKHRVTLGHAAAAGLTVGGGGMIAGMLAATLVYGRRSTVRGMRAAVTTGAMGAAVGVFALLAIRQLSYHSLGPVTNSRLFAWLGYPTIMLFFMLTAGLVIGLTSYVSTDGDREWWARSGGWMLAASTAWVVFAGLVLYSVDVLRLMSGELSKSFTALLGLTGATGYAATKAASKPADSAQGDGIIEKLLKSKVVQESTPKLLVVVFIVLLTVLVSSANLYVLRWWHNPGAAPGAAMARTEFVTPEVIGLGVLYALISLTASYLINVNKFSSQAMYRQRLIRAFLGASNERCQPHPVTGFDETDNLLMAALTSRPLLVVNMAVNLAAGENLAGQHRKTAPFTSTGLHTGSSRLGYRRSTKYGGSVRPGAAPISLGTTMAISGAASSLNMGRKSSPSPALATVMMLFSGRFNARLGWWLGNPRDETAWRSAAPKFGIRAFLDDALGRTNDRNSWVHLSDGGHFENLGIYEMVSRRCHTIVAIDAAADSGYTYEDLGNAVRKVWLDLGIPIEFDPPTMPTSPKKTRTGKFSGHHCALARILYSRVDGSGAQDGILIYIKPSLTGDEPMDVNYYAATDPRFPHQPGADQFVDENQFESYRRLGLHIVERISRGKDVFKFDHWTLQEFVEAALSYRHEDA